MKKYLPYLNLILIVFLFIILITFYKYPNIFMGNFIQNNSNISYDGFGIEWVNNRFSDMFTFITATMTILFSLFAILNYFGIKERINFIIAKQNKKIKKQNKKWKNHSIKIKNLEGDLSFEVARKIQNDVSALIKNKIRTNKQDVMLTELSLTACYYYLNSLSNKQDVRPLFEKSVKGLIDDNLNIINIIIKNRQNEKIELENISNNRFVSLKEYVNKICDTKTKELFYHILNNVNFKNVE